VDHFPSHGYSRRDSRAAITDILKIAHGCTTAVGAGIFVDWRKRPGRAAVSSPVDTSGRQEGRRSIGCAGGSPAVPGSDAAEDRAALVRGQDVQVAQDLTGDSEASTGDRRPQRRGRHAFFTMRRSVDLDRCGNPRPGDRRPVVMDHRWRGTKQPLTLDDVGSKAPFETNTPV